MLDPTLQVGKCPRCCHHLANRLTGSPPPLEEGKTEEFCGLHSPQNKAEAEGSVGFIFLPVPSVHLADGLPASQTGPALTGRVWLAFLSAGVLVLPGSKSGRCSTPIEVVGGGSGQVEE